MKRSKEIWKLIRSNDRQKSRIYDAFKKSINKLNANTEKLTLELQEIRDGGKEDEDVY
jgi:hypothetical protein